MMAKKLRARSRVFQFSMARRTQSHEKVSCATSSAADAPWLSSFIRATAASLSSGVRNLDSDGVCGRKNIVRIPNAMVITPSMKKMKGQPW